MPKKRPNFGDIGTERGNIGERKVMAITAGKVIILSTTIPEDDFEEGVTWEMSKTDWNEPETVENDQK